MKNNDYKSREDLLAEILEQLQKIAKKLPEGNNPSANLGIMDNADMMNVLKITNRTAIRWRKEKKLPYFRIGGKVYYRIADIEKMINDCTGKNNSHDIRILAFKS